MGRRARRPLGLYQRFLNAVPEAALLTSADGSVLRANESALVLFGHSEKELLGCGVELLIPDALLTAGEAPQDGWSRSRAVGGPRSLVTTCRRANGEAFTAHVGLRHVHIRTDPLLVVSVREAVDERREEERLQAVQVILRAVLEGKDPTEVLRQIARRARELAGADLALVATSDSEAGLYRVRAAEGVDADVLQDAPLRPGHSLMAAVASSQTGVTTEDLRGHPQADAHLGQLISAGPAVVVPLPGSAARPASLAAIRRRGRAPFTATERRLVELFAAEAAVALDHARIRDEQRRLALVEERDRIGRELHDGAIQTLFSVGINLQGTEMLMDDPMLRGRLESGVKQIDSVIRDLRYYVFGLRPAGVAQLPLEQALYELADRFERDHAVVTTVDVDGGLAAELAEITDDILQLTREALSNVAKHASARRCGIALVRAEGQAMLQVEDDGRGYSLEWARGGPGWGLRNIEERATALGARVEISTQPGEGTTLRLLIPR